MKNKRSAKIRKSIADILRKIADKIVLPKAETKESPTEQEYREPLAPRILTEKDVHYSSVKELAYAVQQPECKNIAITGVYGSGKSSIINTYVNSLPRYKKKKVLRISLSNFCETAIDGKPEALKKYENEVEYKVFQQIFFKANQRKTRQTKYARISHLSVPHALLIAVGIVFAIIAIAILCVPNDLGSASMDGGQTLNRLLTSTKPLWLLWSAIIYLVFVLSYLITYLLRRFHHINVSRIKTNYVELELTDNDKESFFNAKLNDLLYFFKAGGYHYVIFEDLDRLQYPERLFLKLRELNILLNESDYFRQHHRQIKFIYAIRDDVFKDEIRIKCFDYIISVVPVVDKYNAGDVLINRYHDNLMSGIEKRDLAVLGMYIGGKRELANVVNEFQLNASILAKNKSTVKFLAMLVYKNLFPHDYALAYKKEGCLYAVFDNKERFFDPIIMPDRSSLSETEHKLNEEKELLYSERRKLIKPLCFKKNIVAFVIDGKTKTIDEISKDDYLFEAILDNHVDTCVLGDEQGDIPYDCTYDMFLKESNLDKPKFESTINAYKKSIRTHTSQVQTLRNDIDRVQRGYLSSIMKQLDASVVKEILVDILEPVLLNDKKAISPEPYETYKDRIVEHLYTFIAAGYIAEDYFSYMSQSYNGMLSDQDYHFINIVLQGGAPGYECPIEHPDAIVSRLGTENFKDIRTLNISLLKYLYKNRQNPFVSLMISAARKDPAFIVSYASPKNNTKEFLSDVFDHWDGCIADFLSLADETLRESLVLLLLKQAPTNIHLNDLEKRYLESLYEFICVHIEQLSVKSLIHFVEHHQLKFEHLIKPEKNTTEFYDFVIHGCYYELSSSNLAIICPTYSRASYTSIINADEAVKKYVNEQIVKALEFFPETNTHESPEAMLLLINNQSVPLPLLQSFLTNQNNKINLGGVKRTEIMQFLFEQDLINPEWINVRLYLEYKVGVEDILLQFIKNNLGRFAHMSYDVEYDKTDADGSENKEFQNVQKLLLANNDHLTIYEYRQIAGRFKQPMTAKMLSGLEEKRLFVLLLNNLIDYDKSMHSFMFTYSTHLFARYLIKHFNRYIEDAEFPVIMTNAHYLKLLQCTSSNQQVKRLIDERVVINEEEVDAILLARKICEIYARINDFSNANKAILLKALSIYQGNDAWDIKIDLINKINASIPYDLDYENKLLTALGREYLKFTTFGGPWAHLLKNDQNIQLAAYLRKNHQYVSGVNYDYSSEEIEIRFHRIPKTH